MKYVDPELLFVTEPPTLPIVPDGQYYDRNAIGMSTYLQILSSVGLYGFQYAVYVDNCNKVLDGNFRVYAARELGLLVPVSVQVWNQVYPVWIVRIIRRFRLLFKRNWLFYKMMSVRNSTTRCSLFARYQLDILE